MDQHMLGYLVSALRCHAQALLELEQQSEALGLKVYI